MDGTLLPPVRVRPRCLLLSARPLVEAALGVPGSLAVPAHRVAGLDADLDGRGLRGAHRLAHRLHQVLRVPDQKLRRLLILLRTCAKQTTVLQARPNGTLCRILQFSG